jgi:hypothetical protein
MNLVEWFGHVMRQEETKAVRVVMKMNDKWKRKIRPKINCWIQLRKILGLLCVCSA